jgi:hypothetical protein
MSLYLYVSVGLTRWDLSSNEMHAPFGFSPKYALRLCVRHLHLGTHTDNYLCGCNAEKCHFLL